MNQYLEISLQAVILFPFVVAIFTLPYIAYNYHKYGSVMSLKVVIVYSVYVLPGDTASSVSGKGGYFAQS